MMRVRCSCGQELSIPPSLRTPEIRCPGCGGIFNNPQGVRGSLVRSAPLPMNNQPYTSREFWNKKPRSSQMSTGLLIAIVAVATGALMLGLLLVVGYWVLGDSQIVALPSQGVIGAGKIPELDVTLKKFRASGVSTTFAELDAAYRSKPGLDRTAEWLSILAKLENVNVSERSAFLMDRYGVPVNKINRALEGPLQTITNIHRGIIESAQQMTDVPLIARYPLHAKPSQADKIPEVRNAEKLARLVLFDAYVQSFSGDTSTATKRLVTCLRIAATIEPYPNEVAQIFRYTIICNTADAVATLLELNVFDDTHLAELDREFRQILQTDNAKSTLAGNLVVGLAGYEDLEGTLKYLHGVSSEKAWNYETALAEVKRSFEFDRACFAAGMHTRFESLQNRSRLRQLEDAERREMNTNTFRLAFLLMNPLDKSLGFSWATKHCAETARTAIAVERFRRASNCLPGTLQQLVPQYLDALPVDHFSGSTLQFASGADGYSLFSSAEQKVGKDPSWQNFPPLKLRTTVNSPFSGSQANSNQKAPFPSYWEKKLEPVDGGEKLVRDAEESARANAAVSRQMQMENEAANRPRP